MVNKYTIKQFLSMIAICDDLLIYCLSALFILLLFMLAG